MVCLMLVTQVALAAEAQTVLPRSCYIPLVPPCVTSLSVFNEEWSFQACRRELDQYRAEVIAYDDCLAAWLANLLREANLARDDAIYARERADTAIEIANLQLELYYEAEAEAMVSQKEVIGQLLEVLDYWDCEAADLGSCRLP